MHTNTESPNLRGVNQSQGNKGTSIKLQLLTGTSEKRVTAYFHLLTLEADAVRQFVDVSPFNPRFKDDEAAKEIRPLVKDIKKNGQVEPVWAYKRDGKYYILNGSRRLTATSILNRELILLVTDAHFTDQQLELIANSLANTKELSLMEKGRIFHSMMEARPDMSIEDVAKAKSVSRTLVRSALDAFLLPDYIKDRFNSPSSLGKPAVTKLTKIVNTINRAKERKLKQSSTSEERQQALDLYNQANRLIINLHEIDSDDIMIRLTEEHTEKFKFSRRAQIEKIKSKLLEDGVEYIPSVHDPKDELPELELSDTKVNSLVIKEIMTVYKSSDLYASLSKANFVDEHTNEKLNTLGTDHIDVQTSRIVSGHTFNNDMSTFVVKNLSTTAQKTMLTIHRGAITSITDARTPMTDDDKVVYKQMLKIIGETDQSNSMSSKEKGKIASALMNIVKTAVQEKDTESDVKVNESDPLIDMQDELKEAMC